MTSDEGYQSVELLRRRERRRVEQTKGNLVRRKMEAKTRIALSAFSLVKYENGNVVTHLSGAQAF
jgi:hypothetical protein